MKFVKKVLLWALVAFFVYAVFKSPSQAANIVQDAWNIIVQGAKSITSFFNTILKHN